MQRDADRAHEKLRERVLALEGECAGLRQELQDSQHQGQEAREADRDMWQAELSKARSAVEEKAQEAQVH